MERAQFIKVVGPDSIKTTAVLAKEIWTEYYTPLIGKAQVEYMLTRFQSVRAITKQINDEGYLYYLLNIEDSAIGYIGIVPKVKEGSLFVSKVYVRKQDRNKGYGRQAFGFIEDAAKKMQLKAIALTVNKKNPSVQAYIKMGFVVVDSVVMDIGCGFVMDDYRMEKIV